MVPLLVSVVVEPPVPDDRVTACEFPESMSRIAPAATVQDEPFETVCVLVTVPVRLGQLAAAAGEAATRVASKAANPAACTELNPRWGTRKPVDFMFDASRRACAVCAMVLFNTVEQGYKRRFAAP
jgi:hypothetical protein